MKAGWRSDKRPKISPYVPEWIHTRIHDLANFIGVNDGEAGRIVVIDALNEDKIIECLSPYLLREYCRGYTIWMGRTDYKDLDLLINPKNEYLTRFHMRVSQDEWMLLDEIGYALGAAVAPATAALLVLGLQSRDVLYKIDPGFDVFRQIKITN